MLDEKPPELKPPYPEKEPTPFYVATIVDNIVYQAQNLDGQQAALLLSQPTYVRYNPGEAQIGWRYDPETKTFTRPAYDPETDTFSY
jgi:hypothetical protein